ncbi:MAG: hypothetical protein JNK85_28780 [Verrucomicrobiales bacterium]|nr:hypothetical protein [Verrucomicrobiales bacterium]
MDDLTVIGNQIEAVLWLAFSVSFGVMAYRGHGTRRRLWLMLACGFLVFSLSDVIESQTGAWWKPWWLLVMKTACIAVFLYGMLQYTALRKEGTTQPFGPPNRARDLNSQVEP